MESTTQLVKKIRAGNPEPLTPHILDDLDTKQAIHAEHTRGKNAYRNSF